MRPRLPLLLALAAVLAAGAWYLLDRHWKQRHRDAAVQSHAAERRLEACLVGNGPLPRASDALAARVRRVALAPATPDGWPGDCATHARAMLAAIHATPRPDAAMRAVEARATILVSTLARDAAGPAVRAFRAGDAADVTSWAAPLRALHDAVAALARAHGGAEPVAAERRAAALLPAVNGDVLPVSLDPGSLVIGTSYAGGTLSVLFIEPTRERVFCRTRDRGASMRCRRFAPEGAPRYLVSHDAPEALMLFDRGEAVHAGRYVVASADAPGAALFTLPLAPTSSLPLRAVGDALHAALDDAGASSLARCVRGGSCARFPSGAASQQESVMVSAGGRAWWVGVVASPADVSLDARALPADATTPPGPPAHLAPLRSGASLMGSCHAEGVAYAAVVDASGTHLAAFDAERGPRLLGARVQVGLPFELACDERGVTVSGDAAVQSCARDGACAAPSRVGGVRRFARVAGELVMVSLTRDGANGLRVRHATPERFADARSFAVDDDAAHGGLSARGVWVFAAGDRLVLFAAGATTAVLWSGDRGERWAPTREGYESDGRVMPLGAVGR